ncbi:hypothetical protein K439DRAFT_1622505 [Ramaria rubella]|nr:hypothetical protein K439DRAFT_1622505 [Ramaria rubella]
MPVLKSPAEFFGKAGRDHHKRQLDFATMKLICALGIPLDVVRSAEWKEVFKITSPNYIPASASTIEGFDSGSIRYPQSVETILVTTADWESFLVQGHEASDVSHTADHVENVIVEAIDSIGVEHFSAIASNGASNAKKPWLSALKVLAKHGLLQSAGPHSRYNNCLPAIRHLVSTKQVTIKKVNHLFIEQSSSALRFEFSLNHLIMILLPFAKAILCFEAAHVTTSDVYVFWLAITASIKDVIDDPKNDIDEQTAREIHGIINYCFRELFQEPHGDVYVEHV